MSLDRISIPSESGVALLLPKIGDYGEQVEKNRKLAKNALVDGQPLLELANEARKFAINSALDYTELLGFNVTGSKDPEEPIIATGHQPVMAHPGIALKTFALVKSARSSGSIPLFISQDCDEFRATTVPAPLIDNSLIKRDFTLFPNSREKGIYETAEVEPKSMLLERLSDLRDTLSNPRLVKVADAMDQFLGRLDLLSLDEKSFTSRTIIMRRAWEKPVLGDYLEATVSMVCQSMVFKRFATHIIRELNQFSAIYNSELQKYRILHKLRYRVNPFPDLADAEEWMETPFWVMVEGERERLYARSSGGESLIKSDHMPDTSISEIISGAVDIRPRAIVLSIYQRLFLCDFFIHGVGGAKYDTITDNIINKFFRLIPPSYACVSATLFPDIEVQDYRPELNVAHQTLRDIVGRPEHVAQSYPEIIGEIEPLRLRKEKLVAKILEPNADKKSLGGEIGRLNVEMGEIFSPITKSIKATIDKLEKLQKECEAAHSREYPFFFYQPERVMELTWRRGRDSNPG